MTLIGINGFQEDEGRLPPYAVGHREAARMLSISERTLHTLVKNRELAACKVGGRRLYILDDLRRFLEARRC